MQMCRCCCAHHVANPEVGNPEIHHQTCCELLKTITCCLHLIETNQRSSLLFKDLNNANLYLFCLDKVSLVGSEIGSFAIFVKHLVQFSFLPYSFIRKFDPILFCHILLSELRICQRPSLLFTIMKRSIMQICRCSPR